MHGLPTIHELNRQASEAARIMREHGHEATARLLEHEADKLVDEGAKPLPAEPLAA